MICLDTNVVIGILNSEQWARRRLDTVLQAGERVSISAVVLFELFYGAERSERREHNLRRIESFLAGHVDLLSLDSEDAAEAGAIRSSLERRGTPIGPYDVLIAAQARRRDATLVTMNQREFRRVPGLRLEDWSGG